ncbi:MAG: bifunctional 3-hydroxydecanoyl-ACP dehydratase/trans-2-decenoyl-ACP isomerase [Candidatus Binatia bacterium]
MTYAEFRDRSRFERHELVGFAAGTLLSNAPEGFRSRLPLPPLLMVDRILEISANGQRGRVVAEREVRRDDWYFGCHFVDDPVQPGCLGVDGVWQLLGFYCAWNGALGAGRALGSGEIEFSGQIRPHNRLVRYEVEIVRYASLAASGSTVVVGDGRVLVDDEAIYSVKRAKVGIFQGLGPGERARHPRSDATGLPSDSRGASAKGNRA